MNCGTSSACCTAACAWSTCASAERNAASALSTSCCIVACFGRLRCRRASASALNCVAFAAVKLRLRRGKLRRIVAHAPIPMRSARWRAAPRPPASCPAPDRAPQHRRADRSGTARRRPSRADCRLRRARRRPRHLRRDRDRVAIGVGIVGGGHSFVRYQSATAPAAATSTMSSSTHLARAARRLLCRVDRRSCSDAPRPVPPLQGAASSVVVVWSSIPVACLRTQHDLYSHPGS